MNDDESKEKQPKKPAKSEPKPKPVLKAKKAFQLCHNDYVRNIQPGDDLSDVPELYLPNLKAEEVI